MMVIDYSGRRQVTKNRPRKQPVGIFAVILVSAVCMSFALGVLTGWFIFRQARKADQGQPAPVAGAKGAPQAPTHQGQYPNPEANTHKGGDPPLTFYETLPKGGKAIIGSGLNPVKKESPLPPKPLPALQHPPVQEAAQPSAGTAGKFCVQVASTKERKEAESLKARLTEKGLSAFIVESTIKDRGTWFRVRIGKHLSQEAAGGLAAKAGKGAIVVPE